MKKLDQDTDPEKSNAKTLHNFASFYTQVYKNSKMKDEEIEKIHGRVKEKIIPLRQEIITFLNSQNDQEVEKPEIKELSIQVLNPHHDSKSRKRSSVGRQNYVTRRVRMKGEEDENEMQIEANVEDKNNDKDRIEGLSIHASDCDDSDENPSEKYDRQDPSGPRMVKAAKGKWRLLDVDN